MSADRDRQKETTLPPKLPLDPEERRVFLDRISEKIIGGVYQVSNFLGSGFLERVYENALAVELRQQGLNVSQQRQIDVLYKGVLVGDYIADLLVEECVLVEVKAGKGIDAVHSAQCMNYLKATALTVCLLVNFGAPKAIIKRIVRNF
jgi:GxxExxY protein